MRPVRRAKCIGHGKIAQHAFPADIEITDRKLRHDLLVLPLVLMLNRVKSFVFTQKFRSSRKSLQHSHEHVHDSNEPFLGRKDLFSSNKLSHLKHIEACSTLQRRTASDFQKASTINRGELAISFCDIQGDAG